MWITYEQIVDMVPLQLIAQIQVSRIISRKVNFYVGEE